MTEAEQKLLDIVVQRHVAARSTGDDLWGPVTEAADAVLLERLPPEYERTLRDLCFRAWDALKSANDFEEKHPLGRKLYRQFREEWKKERGCE